MAFSIQHPTYFFSLCMDNFEGRTQKFGQISAAPLTKRRSGGGGGGRQQAPFACRGRFLILMRFIDPRIFDIHRPHPGPQENMQIGGVRCAISQIRPKFREMLGENLADVHF